MYKPHCKASHRRASFGEEKKECKDHGDEEYICSEEKFIRGRRSQVKTTKLVSVNARQYYLVNTNV